jgi:hypothetical protein
MNLKSIILLGAAGLLATVILTLGCDDPGITAPPDGTILITANPGTVVINQEAGEDSGQTSILAQVYDAANFPVEGASVTLVTTGGTLASAGEPGSDPIPLTADINGVVTDTLTLTVADDPSVTVSAKSGTLISDVTVTKTLNMGDIAPVAVADAEPVNLQKSGNEVAFIGSGSFDPDGEIWCYQWTVSNNTPANPPDIIQGAADIFLTYTLTPSEREKFVNAILRVSDDPLLADVCGSRDPVIDPSRFRSTASVTGYRIVCDTVDPNAVIFIRDNPIALAPDDNDENDCPDGISTCAVAKLDGGQSSTSSGFFEWNCGNGTILNGNKVNCIYTVAGTYTVTLKVQNDCEDIDTAEEDVLVQ